MATVRNVAGSQAKTHAGAGKKLTRSQRVDRVPGRVKRTRVMTVVISEQGKPTRKIEVDPLRVKIAIVTEALGSKAKAAQYLGVARSQPGKWLAGEESPNPRARRLIQDFDYVWGRLIDDRSPEVAALWLGSPNAFLSGTTPISWMRARGAEDVVGAIDAEEAGSFA
ncbi:MAG: hypothetical protein ACSLFB_04460 [Acidimicrobiales bacterium]